MRGIFITSRNSLEAEGGGVQRCTREYLRSLGEAGVTINTVDFESDMRWFVRVRRKLRPRPYHDRIDAGLKQRLIDAVESLEPDWIFFNHCEGLPALKYIAETAKKKRIRLAYLSHGLDSTDYVHYHAPKEISILAPRTSGRLKHTLGSQIFSERSFLQRMDLTCCLAPTDLEIHRWLGASKVIHLPRVVDPAPLNWRPVAGRIGTIATLVHAPNYHGIVDLCKALSDSPHQGLKLRIVGRPEAIGEDLAKQYDFVEYLGGLSDAELDREASTWSGFVNPVFSYPRGCSTKLSVPINWGIPIFTSRAGARGYFWDKSELPLYDTPQDLASSLSVAFDTNALQEVRESVQKLALSSPTWDLIGTRLRESLQS